MLETLPSLSALPVDPLREADQAALDAGHRDGRRNIALVVAGAVIVAGLEALLSRTPRIGAVLQLDPDTLHTPYRPGSLDVLIITSDQWHLLKDAQDDKTHPLPPVLVVGDPVQDRRTAIGDLPGDGFLSLTELSQDTLASAIERTLAGEVPMPPKLARELLSMHRVQVPQAKARVTTLTPRENETLQLMASGMSNKQIARALTISTHGAKRLVGSVLAKFDAPNRTAAVVSAVNAGLV
ncbi:LuxR C-terminal-related transcriptional regulator [Streptomyces sp. NPDC057336]|uniref:LuxR C-terminal-related transcriptional regulator n=1 Tax=Streptomyces sp. NPDC057336 TaxID=3346102 RepID=UPI00362A90CC